MHIDDLQSWQEALQENLDADPAFRDAWEDGALAREVAVRVIAFRSERDLSQAAFARLIGVSQPRVATIERGEHIPSLATLKVLANALEVEFAIDVRPLGKPARLLKTGHKHRAVSGGQLTVATA